MSRSRTLKIIALIAAFAMALTCITGCGGNDDTAKAQDAGKVLSETETELTIVDQAGREVTVKKDPKSIALCYRVVIRFLLSLDQGDKITGIGKCEPFLLELQPSLKDCTDVGQGVADIEALAELQPDLFFHKAGDVETLEAVEKIGIPAIGIEIETPDDMIKALEIMGKVCGAEKKAKRLIKQYNDSLDKVSSLVSGIPEKERKTAIVMGTSIGKVADGTMLQGEMLERAGAINCAADLEATELWPTAGTEQIFQWNPEYIFITGSESAVYSADDIYNSKAWSEIEAVKNKNVYVMPAEKDSWEFPGTVSALGIEYMIRTMYPELLDDEQLEKDVKAFYELSYGRVFDRDTLGY
ncbi:MAG: ABC transporter substrate-binding protein [Firmicutes bacterium]|nr:ABC transporter substrate-binding protein [Bacillota bacterium]